MPTTTVNSSEDFVYSSSSTSYTTARAGGGTLAYSGTLDYDTIGQLYSGGGIPSYVIYESYIEFDTSSIPESATVISATLSVYIGAQLFTDDGDWTIEAYPYSMDTTSQDWLALDDFVVGDRVATLSTADVTQFSYNALTSETQMTNSVVPNGTTKILLISQRDRLNTPPSATSTYNYTQIVTNNYGPPDLSPELEISYYMPNSAFFGASF